MPTRDAKKDSVTIFDAIQIVKAYRAVDGSRLEFEITETTLTMILDSIVSLVKSREGEVIGG